MRHLKKELEKYSFIHIFCIECDETMNSNASSFIFNSRKIQLKKYFGFFIMRAYLKINELILISDSRFYCI